MEHQKASDQPDKLSDAQFYVLHVASHYRLKRSSMGWWAQNHQRWGVNEPVVIFHPLTIKSLWRKGLLDGNPGWTNPGMNEGHDSKEVVLWASERGKELLRRIEGDTNIFYDLQTDQLETRGDEWFSLSSSKGQTLH